MQVSILRAACLAATLGLVACGGNDGKDGSNGLNGLDGTTTTVTQDGAPGLAGNDGQNGTDGKSAPRDLQLDVVGRYASGSYGKSAAEIVQRFSDFGMLSAVRPFLN